MTTFCLKKNYTWRITLCQSPSQGWLILFISTIYYDQWVSFVKLYAALWGPKAFSLPTDLSLAFLLTCQQQLRESLALVSELTHKVSSAISPSQPRSTHVLLFATTASSVTPLQSSGGPHQKSDLADGRKHLFWGVLFLTWLKSLGLQGWATYLVLARGDAHREGSALQWEASCEAPGKGGGNILS